MATVWFKNVYQFEIIERSDKVDLFKNVYQFEICERSNKVDWYYVIYWHLIESNTHDR